jgi:hypothetical protein
MDSDKRVRVNNHMSDDLIVSLSNLIKYNSQFVEQLSFPI